MYRIRTLEHRPLIISNALIREYGINRVETLHVKVSRFFSCSTSAAVANFRG